jgi:hypothetical protein
MRSTGGDESVDKGERIRLIQSCRDALEMLPSDDEELVLDTFAIGSRPRDQWGTGPSLTTWLNEKASDAELISLGQHLGVLDNGPVAMSERDVEPGPLFIFASHLSTSRRFLGEVEERLKRYRVKMFVAHDSIPMDADWSKEIVDALNGCHAGAVFLHPGFHQSYYCQQECGWMLGRGIPVARLVLGESPRALLGNRQGKDLNGKGADEVGDAIMDWATDKPALASHVAASLSEALQHSVSYKHTDEIWARLSQMDAIPARALRRILFAAEYNHQVFGTGIGGYAGTPYRQAIAVQAATWDVEGRFTDRISQLREHDSSSLILPPEEELRQYAGLED